MPERYLVACSKCGEMEERTFRITRPTTCFNCKQEYNRQWHREHKVDKKFITVSEVAQ